MREINVGYIYGYINTRYTWTDFKATVEKEIPEDDITGESSANTETENTKEGENVSMFTLFVAAYVIYCVLQFKCCQILSFRT